MSSPSINAAEGCAIAYDIGGTAVRVFNKTEIIQALETEGVIVSASINRDGWFSVCTQEGGGYRGVVTIYNSRGRSVYRAFLGSGYVLSAALSPDSRSLAVLNLTDSGSRITFYHGLNKEEPDSAFDLPGGLILDMRYLPDGKLLAISTESLLVIDGNGEGMELIGFSGRRLGAYTFSDDFFILHLLDYGVGHRGRLVSLDSGGVLLGELATDRELLSISSANGFLVILSIDGAVFYDAGFDEFPPLEEHLSTAGASSVLALGDWAALATSDHLAVVLRKA